MKIHDPKRKNLSLFQSRLHSITISSVIDYILEAHSTSSSLNEGTKKTKGRRKGKRWKRGEEEKRDGKSLCVRKGKRENEMWKKRRKGGRENEREGEEKEKERKRKKNRK